MQTFCTIITAGHLPFAKVLHRSIVKQAPGSQLQVLVVNDNTIASSGETIIHTLTSLENQPLFKEIEKKYAHTDPDHFRWALKPLFISYLLSKGFEKVIFADPDLFFVNDPSFLFSELDQHNIILTPHWANTDPVANEDSLFAVLRGGLFNAGFIGASAKGKEAIDWWAGMCHYKMEKRKELGLYDDQKYLDLMQVQFPGVEIIRHRGCNLASWNIDTCKRSTANGKLVINGEFEPVFIHFAKDTIVNIINKNDELLRPFLDEYIEELKKENVDLLSSLNDPSLFSFDSSFYAVKHKLRFRTRLKRLLSRWAEKL